MCEECSTHGGDYKFIGKYQWKINLENDIGKRKKQKINIKRRGYEWQIGFIWLKIWTSGGLL
jgi:hypothetical protein